MIAFIFYVGYKINESLIVVFNKHVIPSDIFVLGFDYYNNYISLGRTFSFLSFVANALLLTSALFREWMKQQINEKAQEEANLEQAQWLYDLKAIESDQRAIELARAEQECRNAINMAMKDYNLALDRERKTKEELEKQKELEDNLTEISNHVNGDMLTENPSVAQSAFGSHRVIPDRWKGMSPAEVNNIQNIQNQQVEENKVQL